MPIEPVRPGTIIASSLPHVLRQRTGTTSPGHALPDQTAFAAQEAEQGKQRQPEHREIVAFDPLEQMAAEALELVAADARRDRRASRIEVGVEKALRQRAHG